MSEYGGLMTEERDRISDMKADGLSLRAQDEAIRELLGTGS